MSIQEEILSLNKKSMSDLYDNRFTEALNSLKKAQELIKLAPKEVDVSHLKAITLNNYGCLYKRIKKPHIALQYLKRAIKLEEQGLVDSCHLAGSHLNLCAIYSELGNHEEALQEGCKALQLIKSSQDDSPGLTTTLIIAFYNTAVEYEFLMKYEEAYECYKAARDAALMTLGKHHHLTITMGNSLKETAKKFENSKKIQRNHKNILELPKVRKSAKEGATYSRVKTKIEPKRKTQQQQSRFSNNLSFDLKNSRFLTGSRMRPMHSSLDPNNRISMPPQEPTRLGTALANHRFINNSNFSFGKKNYYPTQSKPKQKKFKKLSIQKDKDTKEVVIPSPTALESYDFTPSHLSDEVDTSALFKPQLSSSEFRKMEQAAIKIQSYVRMKQCKVIYDEIRSAVTFIQAQFRLYLKSCNS